MTTIIHDPGNTNPHIKELWAVLSVDEGGEGIISAPLPLLTSEARLVPQLVALAKKIRRQTGKRMRLVKFTSRENLHELDDA